MGCVVAAAGGDSDGRGGRADSRGAERAAERIQETQPDYGQESFPVSTAATPILAKRLSFLPVPKEWFPLSPFGVPLTLFLGTMPS